MKKRNRRVRFVATAFLAASLPLVQGAVAAETADSIYTDGADMVILSDNPITIDPAKINTIQVLETIKEGRTVYVRQ